MNLTTCDSPRLRPLQAVDAQAMLEADHHLTMAEGQVLSRSPPVYEASVLSWAFPDLRLPKSLFGGVSPRYRTCAEQTSGTPDGGPQMPGISAIVLQRVQSDPLLRR